jgi:hypothetical protein
MPEIGKHRRGIRIAGDEGAVASFLRLLAADMETTLERIAPLDADLLARIGSLVGHIPVERDEDLCAPDLI